MATDLVINATSFEIRIALVEHGNLVEFFLERPMEKGLVGNIYKGKVVRVLPGMQAAFVDIGLERTGFLYVDDIHILTDEFERRFYSCERPCCEMMILLQVDLSAEFLGRILKSSLLKARSCLSRYAKNLLAPKAHG